MKTKIKCQFLQLEMGENAFYHHFLLYIHTCPFPQVKHIYLLKLKDTSYLDLFKDLKP